MLKKILGLMVLMPAALLFAGPTVPEGEIPFGVWAIYRPYADYFNYLDDMRDNLGFNFIHYAFDDTLISSLASHDLLAVFRALQNGNPDIEQAFKNYERSHYLKIAAKENADTVRFLTKDGANDGDWFIPSRSGLPGSRRTVLDNLTYQTSRLYIHTDNDTISFLTRWRMLVEDSETIDDTATVAIFTAFFNNSPIDSSIITGSQFTSDTMEISCFSYQMPGDGWVRFKLETFNNCDLKIDWFKVYNDEGRRCVEDSAFNSYIANYVNNDEFEETVMNWYMRDEPWVDNIQPLVQIADVIRNSTATAFNDTTYEIVTLRNGYAYIDVLKYYLEKSSSKPPVIFKVMYPFKGQVGNSSCATQTMTSYYGWDDNANDHTKGLQTNLQYNLTWPAESITTALGDSVDWWMIAQAWEEFYRACDNKGPNRYPTKSELSCEVFMGLCHGAKGIAFYDYGGRAYDDKVYNCIRDTSLATTHLWDKIHEEINPYIKAIGETYLDLTSDTGYTVDARYDFPSASSGFIDDITAVTNPDSLGDTTNPDLGWFHIGEYHDDASKKYFMLVNRACSRDEEGTEAPSVTATVWFNREKVGSDFARVIDIAKTVNKDTHGNWIGIPDTVRTGIAKNGAIPYVTTLRAGEGRLYKIIPISN